MVHIINDRDFLSFLSKIQNFIQTILEDHHSKNHIINLVISDDNELTYLNENYRGKSGPTDVLSFSQIENEDLPTPKDTPLELGDVIISIDRAQKQAQQYNVTLEEELARLAIHGTLHLLGYDHEAEDSDAEKMFQVQDEYMEKYQKI